MNRDTRAARLAYYAPRALALFRVVFGILWFAHGSSKVFGWPVGPAVETGIWPRYYAGWVEMVTGVLIVIGLSTRIAAFFACGEMATALASVILPQHIPVINGKGELVVLYGSAYMLLIFTGAGTYAVDRLRPKSLRLDID